MYFDAALRAESEGKLLYEKTTAKLSASAMDVLTAAQVDISALITGTAEQLIGKMKED